jgi:hypothetical protein
MASKRSKEKIPVPVKNALWSLHFQNNITGICQCCKTENISRNNFDCGHIVSEKAGGNVELTNLRPICRACNSSMGTMNMDEYMKKYGFDKINTEIKEAKLKQEEAKLKQEKEERERLKQEEARLKQEKEKLKEEKERFEKEKITEDQYVHSKKMELAQRRIAELMPVQHEQIGRTCNICNKIIPVMNPMCCQKNRFL